MAIKKGATFTNRDRNGEDSYLHGVTRDIRTYDDLNKHIKKQKERKTGGVPDPKDFLKVGADCKHEVNDELKI